MERMIKHIGRGIYLVNVISGLRGKDTVWPFCILSGYAPLSLYEEVIRICRKSVNYKRKEEHNEKEFAENHSRGVNAHGTRKHRLLCTE